VGGGAALAINRANVRILFGQKTRDRFEEATPHSVLQRLLAIRERPIGVETQDLVDVALCVAICHAVEHLFVDFLSERETMLDEKLTGLVVSTRQVDREPAATVCLVYVCATLENKLDAGDASRVKCASQQAVAIHVKSIELGMLEVFELHGGARSGLYERKNYSRHVISMRAMSRVLIYYFSLILPNIGEKYINYF
jgi:hypothetical protein